MSNERWIIIVNKECSIVGGNRRRFDNRSGALTVAMLIANILYAAGVSRHIFVVKEEIYDLDCDDIDELKYTVKYHYSVVCNEKLKMLLSYEGYADNQKKIASQWLDEEGK